MAKYPPPPQVDRVIEQVARLLVDQSFKDPDRLEPGDAYGVDDVLPNGDPAHRLWRSRVEDAEELLALIDEERSNG